MDKRKGLLWETAEQLKGHGAEHWVRSVSEIVSQWLKPSKCQQSAHFTVMIVIRQKRGRRPVSTSQSSNKDTSLSCLLNPKHNCLHEI